MKKTSVIVISSSVVITTLIYALVVTIFFELNDASGEDIGINDADSDKTSAQELVEKSCKSPYPPTAEMCIQMCAQKLVNK